MPKPSPKVTKGELPTNPNLKSKTAKMAQDIRWALTKANETEVVDYVKSLPTSESLPLLDLMRKNVQAAAQAIQSKIEAQRHGKESCEFCHGPKHGRDWRMVKAMPNEITRLQENHFWCSDACVARWNQKRQGGIAMLPDRGGKFAEDQPLREN